MVVGTKISQMDPLATLAAGDVAPVVRGTFNYKFDLGAKITSMDSLKANLSDLAASGGAGLVGNLPSGTGAQTRTAAQVMDEVVYASNFTGYVEAGESTGTNSYAAIMAAIAAANARNRPLIIQGRPRITQSIKLTAPTHIKFEGSHFVPGQLNGGTALIKASSCTGPAIQINPAAFGTVIEGGGIIGEVGNTGDGLVIWGNSVVIRDFGIQGMGRDGIRIGGYVLGDTWYDAALSASVNANSFRLDNVISNLNGRDGMQVDDQKGGAIDANTGLVSRCQFNNNARHGLYCDKTYLGTVFDGCLFEANTNYGIALAPTQTG